jgi:hypothetical protein
MTQSTRPRGHAHLAILIVLALASPAAGLCVPAVAQAQRMGGPAEDRPIDAPARQAVIQSLADRLDHLYVFPEMGTKMKKELLRRMSKHEFDGEATAEALAGRLTTTLQSICNDKHLRVQNAPAFAAELSDTTRAPEPGHDPLLDQLRRDNYGFQKLELLPGNVGYLDLRSFASPEEAGPTAVAAMRWLAGADAIVIDLRHNGGGSAGMIQLLSSYLFGPEPVHLNSFYWRARDVTEQRWTLPYVEGERRPDVPVFLLTSRFTFSAAEEFTYNLKNLERATVIGETTGGGAHPVNPFPLENGFVVILPVARAINPITNTNWEGTGIAPNIACPADRALEVAHREALKGLAAKAGSEEERKRLGFLAELVELRAQVTQIDAAKLGDYVGRYGPRTISAENGSLYFQREGGPRFRMLSVGGDRFLLEARDDIRVEFARDPGGAVAAMEGTFPLAPGFRSEREPAGH